MSRNGSLQLERPSWFRWAGEVGLIVAAAGVDLLVWDSDNELRGGQTAPAWVVPLATLVLYPLLLLRWRYPRAVFAVHWAYSLAGLFMPLFAPFAGLLVAVFAMARLSPPRLARAALAVCVVPFAVNSFNFTATAPEGDSWMNFLGAIALWSALTAMVWGLGRLMWATERRTENEKREQAAAAVRAERLHLARELHDIVSHSVSAMTLQAAGARTLASRADVQVQAALEAIETTGVQAMGELHRLLGLLRAVNPSLDQEAIAPAASLDDLESVVESARASGVEVDVVVEGSPSELDPSVGLAAYRVVQESLTNTIKYAGHGASSRIHLRWGAQTLTLTVRDRTGLAARATPELSSGHGLMGLHERISLMGGTLETGPVPDGYLVQAHLPLRSSESPLVPPNA